MTPDDANRIRILRLEKKLARVRFKRDAAYKEMATYKRYLGDVTHRIYQLEYHLDNGRTASSRVDPIAEDE